MGIYMCVISVYVCIFRIVFRSLCCISSYYYYDEDKGIISCYEIV